ncbi:MAG: phosphotransferase [Clostridia bacterium]|nr:phosphotransferase [Clostridia bacterium]
MKILDNSDKHLLPILPEIISKELGKNADKFKFIGGGSFGRVYKAVLSDGETIAVKAYRVQGSQYEEAEQLKLLSGNTSVKMPEVLFVYEDEDTAILAMSFCPGQNVLSPMFLLKSKEQKQKFARDVVSGMLGWHSVTNDKFGSLGEPLYDNWYDYYKEEKQKPWLSALKELSDNGKFSKKKLQLLIEATDLFNNLPEENTKPVLIHGDLNIMNIMADSKTLELTAFIDPCGSMWADREYDLFQLRNMWGDAYGLYEEYKRRAGSSEFTDFRVAYYASVHEAAMRLKGGLIMPVWEELNNARLKKEIKKLKEKM